MIDNTLVQISDTPIDLAKVNKVYMFVTDSVQSQTQEIPKDLLSVDESLGEFIHALVTDDGTGDVFPMVYSVYTAQGDYKIGTYVLCVENPGDETVWVSRIELAETIHTIDPKFIPGAVLPVVAISPETVVNMLSGEPFEAKPEEAAAFISAKETGKAIRIDADFTTVKFSAIANLVPGSNYDPEYKSDFGIGTLRVVFSDDGTVTLNFTSA